MADDRCRSPWLADQATIRVETVMVYNRRVNRFFWEGPCTATVLVAADMLDIAKEQLPWPVRIVKHDWQRKALVIARADGPYILSWLYHTAIAGLRNWTAVFRARFIITLMGWGLAYVPVGEIPSWRHIGKATEGTP